MTKPRNQDLIQSALFGRPFRISAKIPPLPGIAFNVSEASKIPHRLPSEERSSSLVDLTKGAGTNADVRRPPALAGTRAGTLVHTPGRTAVDLPDNIGTKCAATI